MKKTLTITLICTLLLLALTTVTGCLPSYSSAAEQKWQFIVTGDSRDTGKTSGVNTAILNEIAAEIVKVSPDFVLFPGDLVVGSKDAKKLQSQLDVWRNTMQPVYDADIPVYAVRGNHDLGPQTDSAGLSVWNTTFAGQYALPKNGPASAKNLTYTVTHKNAFVVALDQYAIKGKPLDLPWINEQLQNNNKPHVFVFGHEPAFAVKHTDCLDDRPAQRNEFISAITAAGGKTYFCGHDHLYDHIAAIPNNDPANTIHQFIVGTAGAPLYPHDGNYKGDNAPYTITPIAKAIKHGYLIVNVNGQTVTTIWMQRTAPGTYATKDTWTYTITQK